MNRLNVIQEIINKINAKTYLEIGVETGAVFFNVNVDMKIGVDPNFLFKLKEPINEKLILKDACLYQMTSNEFYNKESHILKNGVDIVFIDGLHTYKQVIKDVENSLKYLNDNGVIILHDCNPPSAAIGYPVKNSINEVLKLANQGLVTGWNGCWCGDVWKAILALRTKNKELNIFTLDLDWGLGIITKKKDYISDFKITKKINLENLTYSYLEKNRNHILNLKPPSHLADFLLKIAPDSVNTN